MLNLSQFREKLVRPVLEGIKMYSPDAGDLVVGTFIQESRLFHLVQLGDGPALGLGQMEPATHDDIWDNWLSYRDPIVENLIRTTGCSNQMITGKSQASILVGNLSYAVAMCRIHYRRYPEPIGTTVEEHAALWKLRYNSALGKGTIQEFITHYNRAHAEQG